MTGKPLYGVDVFDFDRLAEMPDIFAYCDLSGIPSSPCGVLPTFLFPLPLSRPFVIDGDEGRVWQGFLVSVLWRERILPLGAWELPNTSPRIAHLWAERLSWLSYAVNNRPLWGSDVAPVTDVVSSLDAPVRFTFPRWFLPGDYEPLDVNVLWCNPLPMSYFWYAISGVQRLDDGYVDCDWVREITLRYYYIDAAAGGLCPVIKSLCLLGGVLHAWF